MRGLSEAGVIGRQKETHTFTENSLNTKERSMYYMDTDPDLKNTVFPRTLNDLIEKYIHTVVATV